MKVKMTTGKKFTLNTQNYSSISPTITLEIVDGVKAESVSNIHRLLDTIADCLLHEQMENDLNTMAAIKKMGFGEYFKSIDREKMDESFKRAIDDLIGIKEKDN